MLVLESISISCSFSNVIVVSCHVKPSHKQRNKLTANFVSCRNRIVESAKKLLDHGESLIKLYLVSTQGNCKSREYFTSESIIPTFSDKSPLYLSYVMTRI